MDETECRQLHAEIKETLTKIIHLKASAIEAKTDGLRAAILERQMASDKALELKSKDLERRLDELNHWKKEALDERSHFLNEELYRAEHKNLEDKLEVISTKVTTMEAHYTNRITMSLAIAGISLIIGVIVLITRIWPH